MLGYTHLHVPEQNLGMGSGDDIKILLDASDKLLCLRGHARGPRVHPSRAFKRARRDSDCSAGLKHVEYAYERQQSFDVRHVRRDVLLKGICRGKQHKEDQDNGSNKSILRLPHNLSYEQKYPPFTTQHLRSKYECIA